MTEPKVSSPAKNLYGDGSLFWLTFKVKGITGSTSPLDLLDYVAQVGGSTLNVETTPGQAASVPLLLSDGVLHVQDKGMLGDVSNDGVVSAIDAYQTLQISVGNTAPTPQQVYAADVNGDALINSADVSMILYYAVYAQWPLPPSTALNGLAVLGTSTTLSLGTITGSPGGLVTVSLNAQNLSNWAGGDWTITFDPKVITEVIEVKAGSFAPTITLAYHNDAAGQLKVSMAGRTPLSGSGELLKITLRLANTAGTTSPIVLSGAHLSDPYGRDFVLSALQGKITTANGAVQVKNFNLFLPSVTR
jgi:hypothetical protein